MSKKILLALLCIFIMRPQYAIAATDDSDSLELMESKDYEILNEKEVKSKSEDLMLSDIEMSDDLKSLKEDIGADPSAESASTIDLEKKKTEENPRSESIATTTQEEKVKTEIFDVGDEEKKLLEISKFVQNKMTSKEWNEIAITAKTSSYVVQKGDWLWKICKQLFGSGFYYSKIWALNPYITNPHLIEPGMSLVFSTGDMENPPNLEVSAFPEDLANSSLSDEEKQTSQKIAKVDMSLYGEDTTPPWLAERAQLQGQGYYFQYATDDTYKELDMIGEKKLNKEYENYIVPESEIFVPQEGEQKDDVGFDKYSKIKFNFNEGFYLNTFVTSNVVVDLGEIDSKRNEKVYVQKYETIYVSFDSKADVKSGDMFSVYIAHGKVAHKISDRIGYKYSTVAQIKALRQIDNVWECEVVDQSGLAKRGDRITLYMSKINKISRYYNKRNIEAAVISGYRDGAGFYVVGDVVYLDRGRIDGVEVGTIFDMYDFYDRGTDKRITKSPTYKIGEITVLTVTDNFATGLITNASEAIELGTIAVTKTAEQAARETRLKNGTALKNAKNIDKNALEELDVELNVDGLGKELLDKADSVKLTDEELEELERQEREKSIIKDHEKDLKELEKLEDELSNLENDVRSAKVDEDKYLEDQNLDDLEKKNGGLGVDALDSINDLEKDLGLKYMDQDLNAKENPYGLTEFDLEEIDELLNSGSKK